MTARLAIATWVLRDPPPTRTLVLRVLHRQTDKRIQRRAPCMASLRRPPGEG